MEYKIGDLVKVRDDLQEDKMYGGCSSIEDMLKFRGTLDFIENIDEDGDYHLANNNNPYVWSEEMLEPIKIKDDLKHEIKKKNNMKYKIGDIAKVRNDLQKGEMYDNCEVLEGMLDYTGLMYIIDKIDIDGTYRLKTIGNPEDTNYYAWHEDMLEPVTMKNNLEESTTFKMDRLGIYQYLLNNLDETYEAKNNDYGNSVADTYEKFGCVSFLVRITDKYNRLMTLCNPNAPEQRVKDEKIDDTILDLANYCLLWLVEREYRNQ